MKIRCREHFSVMQGVNNNENDVENLVVIKVQSSDWIMQRSAC